MERRNVGGVIYEGDDVNGWVVVGYEDAPASPSVVGTPRGPSSVDAARIQAERDRIALAQAENDRQTAAAGRGTIPSGMRLNAQGQIEPIPTAPGTAPILTAEARAAALAQYNSLPMLATGVAELRQRFERDLSGRNPLEGRVGNLRPQDAVFDDASGSLAAYVAAALGLSGQQFNSPAEQQLFIGSILPNATDNDEQIAAKIGRLENMVGLARNRGRATLGFNDQNDPLASNGALARYSGGDNGPNNLPRAAGATGDQVGLSASGVTGEGGLIAVPGLSGLGAELASMVQSGRPANEVIAAYNARRAQAGYPPDPAQINVLRYAVDMRRRNPQTPLTTLVQGWNNFELAPAPGPSGFIDGLVSRAADTRGGAGIISAANAVSAGNLGNIAGDNARMALEYSRQERPGASLVGDVAGTVIGMTGLQRLGGRLGTSVLARGGGVVGDALYGGIRGASETDGDATDRLLGGLLGAGAATAGNAVGSGIAGGLGRGLRGVSDPAVRYLAERGIRMTPGQILGRSGGMFGRGIRGMENTLESVPVAGQSIAQRRLDSLGDYTRAQINENAGAFGVTPTGATARDMLASARGAVSDQYRALDGVTFNPMQDGQFIGEAGAAVRRGAGLNRTGEDFETYFRQRIDPAFDANGNLPGRNFQDVLQGVDAGQASFQNDGALGALASDALGDFGDALRGAASRQSPDAAEALRLADLGHVNVTPLENAANTAATRGGEFTPAMYIRAATTNTRRFGGRARAAQGDIPGGELAQYANDVLPSIVPNSGTADRAFGALALPAALGGASYGADQLGAGNTSTLLAALAALSAGYTPVGQRVVQGALVNRPDRIQQLGAALLRRRRPLGMFGAAAGGASVPLLTGQ